MLTENQLKILNMIANNKNITHTLITRRMHRSGLSGEERGQIIDDLLSDGLIIMSQPYIPGRSGIRAKRYQVTDPGRKMIDSTIQALTHQTGQ